MRSKAYSAMIAAIVLLSALFLPLARSAFAQGNASLPGEPSVKDQFLVTVVSSQLHARTSPSLSAPVAATLNRGDRLWVYGQVDGDEVAPGNVVWFKTLHGYYIYSGGTNLGDLSGVQRTPGMTGRWIEVDRGTAVAHAVDDGTVVHIAATTVGTPEFPTPLGTFTILRRVANETMDSATIGIPRNAPHGYYLTNVLYTQYFTNGGAALHYNYWSPADAFGTGTGSHGCVGLELDDAAYFWNFAGVGTPVVINP